MTLDPSSSVLTKKFDYVFDPNFGCYNGAFSDFQSVVNMGLVPPLQQKGHLPLYSRNMLVDLQQKFDKVENCSVFKCPDDAGVIAEYLNPLFLVKKSSGGFRLVTTFGDVGQFCKPLPFLMPDVNTTLCLIGQWKYISTS